MKKLANIAAENAKKVSRETIKVINNEAKQVREARKSASEVIRMIKQTETGGATIATLLGIEQTKVNDAEVKAVKGAVNACYPFKSEARNVAPRAAYIKRGDAIYTAVIYVEVSDYLQALTRAAKAKARNEAQTEVATNIYYIKEGNDIVEEIPFGSDGIEVVDKEAYTAFMQAEAKKKAARGKKTTK